jgi:hypothetical protein
MIMDFLNQETDLSQEQQKSQLRSSIEEYFRIKLIPTDMKLRVTGASEQCPASVFCQSVTGVYRASMLTPAPIALLLSLKAPSRIQRV